MRATRRYILFFAALTCIYHSNLRPIASGDSLPASLIPFSIVFDGTVRLNRFGPSIAEHNPNMRHSLFETGGNWYSSYPIAGPVLVTPLYLPLAAVPSLRQIPIPTLMTIARISEKFVAAALAALSAVWMLILLRRIAPEAWAWPLAWIFAVGTAAWSTSSQALWQHTFGQVAIVGCFYFLERRWFFACGAAIAIAIAVRPTNVLLVPAIAAALWIGRAPVGVWVRTIATAGSGALITAMYNWSVFGRFTGVYPSQLDGGFFDGLAGVLVSPGRGLLVYTPVAVFAAAAFLPRASRQHEPLRAAAAVFAVLQVAVIAKWPMWWGGYCWGPRLLTEIVPGLVVLIALGAPALDSRGLRSALAAAAVYGMLIQALGVYYYPKGFWDGQPVGVDTNPARLWDWRDNPILRTLRAGPAWEPYVVVSAGLRDGYSAAGRKLRQYGINTF